MHRRQSAGLIDWIASDAERCANCFFRSTNAELESLLGGVDRRTRLLKTESTIICGSHATNNRNRHNPL
jgi:hypothetical protein